METRDLLKKKNNFTSLYGQLSKHSDKWSTIGVLLGFKQSELDIIQARPFLLNSAPHSWLSVMLTEWLEWAPGDDRGSVDFATLNRLKKAMNKA